MSHAAFHNTLRNDTRLLVLRARGRDASTARAVRTVAGRFAIIRARAKFREELGIKAGIHVGRPLTVSTMICTGFADAATTFTLSKACIRERGLRT